MPMPENDTDRLMVCCCFSTERLVTRAGRIGKPTAAASLHSTQRCGKHLAVKLLVGQGADVTHPNTRRGAPPPYEIAIQNGNHAIAEILLQRASKRQKLVTLLTGHSASPKPAHSPRQVREFWSAM